MKSITSKFRLFSFLLALIFITVPIPVHADSSPKTPDIPIPSDIITFTITDKDCIFSLKNLTNDYTWNIQIGRSNIVEYQTVSVHSSNEQNCTKFKFCGISRGFTDVTFTLIQSGHHDTFIFKSIYRISVNANGEIISVFNTNDGYSIHATIHNNVCTFAVPFQYNTDATWRFEISPDNIVQMYLREYVYYDDVKNGDGMYYYTCQGINQGKCKVNFLYKEEPIDTLQTECFSLLVNKRLNIVQCDRIF